MHHHFIRISSLSMEAGMIRRIKCLVLCFFLVPLFGCINLTSSTLGEVSYTIVFETNGGEELSPISVKQGSTITLPTATKEGFTWRGWSVSNDGNSLPFTGRYQPMHDMIFYAVWQIDQYTINFVANGGTEVADITQDYGSVVFPPTSNRGGDASRMV